MGLFKKLFGGGMSVKQASTMTPEQMAYMNQMMQSYGQYMPGMIGQMNQMAMNPTSSYQAPDASIGDFFQSTVRDPAMYAWQNEMLPAMEAQYGNKFHSSARAKGISREFGNLQNSLNQQRGNMFYQHGLAQQGLRQQGMESGLARQMQAMGMMQQGMGSLLGQKTFENVASPNQGMFGQVLNPILTASAAYKNFSGGGA